MAGNDAATPQTMDGSAPEQLRIPSEDASITAVEFPGFVRNPDRAMQMLGGEKAIAEACEGGGYLKLSFRPEEPTCHPVFGDSKPTSRTLLLRVSKPRSAPADEPAECQIVGRITATCRFRSLADFQYLPVDTTYATRDYSQTPESNLPEKAEPSGAVDPLMCLPPLFARVDVPFDYDYRQYRYAGELHASNSCFSPSLEAATLDALQVPRAWALPLL
jgi:general transcription factor 3C polypeptide 5 (transcription factor C subunit 1)